ncbi:MAG: branched-chain amino acid aminotransferase [Planctomycetales bacterium]
MKTCAALFASLYRDEAGFIVSAELVLVLTIGVLAMVVGLHAVAKSVVMELNDVASAFGALDQSFCFEGLKKAGHAHVPGGGFRDREDACDCAIIAQTPPNVKVDRSGNTGEAGFGRSF